MGEREFENPYPDYEDNSEIYDFENNQLKKEIKDSFKEKILSLLETYEKHLAAEPQSSDPSVYTGSAGIALFYMKLMDSQLPVGEKDFLKCALSYVEPYLRQLKKKYFTFLCGISGPLAIASILYQRKGMVEESQDFCKRIESLADYIYGIGNKDELLYGRAGYLYALLFLNKYLNKTGETRDSIIKKVINTIFISGQVQAKQQKDYSNSLLLFTWHEKFYIGAAHGLSGILYVLLQAKDYLTQKHLEELKQSIDFILSLEFPSGNFPSSLGNKEDRLVQWCHGAPGVIFLFLLAYETFREYEYLKAAKKCSDVIWRRGLLKKGYGLCHGVAGNGYAHLRLFQVTKDVKYLWRAVKFAEWCFDYETRRCRTPDRPFSLFEGTAGSIYYLIDILEPMNAAFPAFQLF